MFKVSRLALLLSALGALPFLLLSPPQPALARQLSKSSEIIVELDPAATQINFTLGATFHTVHGSFKLKRGEIRYDLSTGKAGGEIVVDATSGASGNPSRDRKMHSEILQSQQFPEITFLPDAVKVSAGAPGSGGASKTIEPREESQLQFHGQFKLHGSIHEMTLTAQIQSLDGRPAATVRFVVPYVQWGLKNPSTFLLRVSDKVNIEIRAVGLVKPV